MKPRRMSFLAALIALLALSASCRGPQYAKLQLKERKLPLSSFLYAADGSLITSFHGEQNRVRVSFSQIPQWVRDAVVAIEDARFYQHRGIDLRALLRAAYVNARSGKILQGGSTITEQYVKIMVLGPEQTISRKLNEARLAWQVEHRLTKNQILARYLNTVYFGAGAYGIQAAARTYFSKPVWELTLAEGALLAGLISAPADYDPLAHPKRALARRNLVLSRMWELGMIPQRKYKHATSSRLRLRPSRQDGGYFAPYFVEHVKQWFLNNKDFGSKQRRYNLLFKGGLRIHTTLDPKLQQYAEKAIDQVLVYQRDPYGAMTVIDPRTGYIKAMVGGRDFFSKKERFAKLNLATGGSTGRQAGSAFKVFALVAALEEGISPQKVYPSPPKIVIKLPEGSEPPTWPVQNYDGAAYGNITVDQATYNSVNVVYAQIIRTLGHGDPFLGARKVVKVARRMGITSRLRAVPSAVLGTNEVNTLEMASAYGTLATGGYYVPPVAVSQIRDRAGNILYQAPHVRKRVLSPAVASLATQILKKVVLYGTGYRANIGRPAFGKTGTAQEWRDAWFIGAVPQLAAAVWVGFPQGQISMRAPRVRLSYVVGGTWPAEIWHAFMAKATANLPVRDFRAAEVDYVTVAVDVVNDCIPSETTPRENIRYVRFIEGTEPTRPCPVTVG